MSSARPIRLRYRAKCAGCGLDLPPGSGAVWDRTARTATCLQCIAGDAARSDGHRADTAPPPLDRGEPGGSARRRYERFHDRRNADTRQRLGRFAGIYLALSNEPRSMLAWAIGSTGERKLGAYLDALSDDHDVIVLHDRRIPGTRTNIDHVAITRGGIFVIDAKRYAGKVRQVDRGGWFKTDLRLYVGKRDCARRVAAMAKQVAAVESAAAEAAVDVTSVLCFIDAEWSPFARPFQVGGVWIEWPASLRDRLITHGPIDRHEIRVLARRVAAALPTA